MELISKFIIKTKKDRFKEFSKYLSHYDKNKIKRKFFSKNFTNDILPTIKFLQEIANFSKDDFYVLLKKKPKAFLMLENNNDKYRINQKVSIKEIHEYFTQQYHFNKKCFKCLFLKYPQIFNLTMKEIIEITTFVATTFELSRVLFIIN